MPLTKFQQSKCLEFVDKLIAWPICSPFIEPVDPQRDGAPDYLQIISKPMALTQVRQKLISNEYDSLEDWRADLDLIWENAKTYNGEDTLITHMAMEAKLWLSRKMERFPDNQEHEWITKIQRTSKKLDDILSHPPSELDPTGRFSSNHEQSAEEEKTEKE